MSSTSATTDPDLLSHGQQRQQQQQHQQRARSHLQNIDFQSLAVPGTSSLEDEDDMRNDNANGNNGIMGNNSQKLPRATLAQKIRVLNWHNSSEKKNQLKTVKHFAELGEFSVTKSTLNRWVFNEEKLRKEYDNLNVGNAKVYKTKPKFKYPKVNRCLEIYYDQTLNEGKKYPEKFMISKWTEFYKMFYQADDDVLANLTTKSNGWLHYFKKRNQIKKLLTESYYKQRDELRITNLQQEKTRLQRELKNYSTHQIYQFDEISIKTDFPFFGINSSLNEIDHTDILNQLSFINPTKRITIGCLANAAGANQFPPLILTDLKVPSNQLSVPNLYWNKNAMLTSEIFFNYLKKLNGMIHEPIVILCDNYYPHFIPTEQLSNIKLCYFSPSLNHLKYYPMDYGVLRLYKVMIKDCILQFFLKKIMLGFTQPKDFEFTKIDLISFAVDSWAQLIRDPHLFVQCFKNSEILPTHLYDLVDTDDDDKLDNDDDTKRMFLVKDNARESQLIGLLKIFNDRNYIRINYTIDSFVFPKDENVTNVHMTEKDIVLLVKREFDDQKNSSFFEDDGNNNNNNNSQLQLDNDYKLFEDTTEIRELNLTLLRKIKPFFDKNSQNDSALQFSKFLNCFVKETNAIFLNSFMSDNNIKEKIERKRKRDETISASDRYLEFQNNQNSIHEIQDPPHIVPQSSSSSSAYDFNDFNNREQQHVHRLQQQLQQQQAQQQAVAQNSGFPMNFNLPVKGYPTNVMSNSSASPNNTDHTATNLSVVQAFHQQLNEQYQQQ